MEESIYNLVPREYSAPKKEKMYNSKWDPDRVYPGSTFGNACLRQSNISIFF